MLSVQYRSDQNQLARDFYRKCLLESCWYRRAVGFFASSVFAACPEEFYEFFARGGRMQVVSSHVFSYADINAIVEGYRDRPRLVRETTTLQLLNKAPSQINAGLTKLLPWLIANNYLDIKVARVSGTMGSQIYHEKLGVFQDEEGGFVAFSGSANESYAAIVQNFESIDVYRSWFLEERRRAEQKKRDFKRLWDNQTEGLEVYSFAEAARRNLLAIRATGSRNKTLSESDASIEDASEAINLGGLEETLRIPSSVSLRPHQTRAIREWFSEQGRGILQMATGSGKTITALSCAVKLYEIVEGPLFIVVIAPYLHLVDQWADEARAFGLDPLPCARGRDNWYEEFSVRLYNMRVGTRKLASVIVSNATFRTKSFQRLLNTVDVPLLVIGDEAHNLGALNNRNNLPLHAAYRLGLSATPERWFDDDGTKALISYFGPTLVDYTLREALNDGVLCPYQYFPHLVELTEEEFEKYYELSTRIARSIHGGESLDDPSSKLERLLIERARLIASARNKLPLLRSLMEPFRTTKHNLVYCGDGRVEEPSSDEEVRQIQAVAKILGHDLLMQAATYTAETPSDARKRLRTEFADGTIQCLIAIRCLDEGVDIPQTQRAFILASSTNPRQFIQRRGRLLRRAPGKDMAEIHDFIVTPPAEFVDHNSLHFNATRALFGKELRRAIEFAGLATNGPEAMGTLLDLQEKLHLLDLGVDENVPAK